MASKYPHPSDEELLLFADGELSTQRVSQVNAHLAACWDCRIRLKQLEETIADFVCAYHGSLDPRLPPSAGPRALLKARLFDTAGKLTRGLWSRWFQEAFPVRRLAYAGMVVLALILAATVAYRFGPSGVFVRGAFRHTAGYVPDPRLTPGVVRQVSRGDVCTVNYSDDTRRIPSLIKQKVLDEYGMSDAQSKDYELDYLISPQLGGTEDLGNLWPEPTSAAGWNLRVKDALENRLHQMVCQGELNLSTAQSDLATDWIGAYKRYFHTDQPIEPL
jgi:hypothetical protein